MLARGANGLPPVPPETESGRSDASLTRNAQIIKLLLNAESNPNARNAEGLQPLHLAAAHNTDPSVVRLLLFGGAETHVNATSGKTPIVLALEENSNPIVIEALLSSSEALSKLESTVSAIKRRIEEDERLGDWSLRRIVRKYL